MPNKGQSYYAKINAIDAKLDNARLALREAGNRSFEIKNQIDKLIASVSASEKNKSELIQSPLDIRIENLKTKLDELLLQYTEQHPDVISANSALAQLKKQKQAMTSNSVGENELTSSVINSPLYQDLNVMLGKTKSEAAALRVRVQEYEKTKRRK